MIESPPKRGKIVPKQNAAAHSPMSIASLDLKFDSDSMTYSTTPYLHPIADATDYTALNGLMSESSDCYAANIVVKVCLPTLP